MMIMLPPDPPTTMVCFLDLEYRMAGDIEEGGCSPMRKAHRLMTTAKGQHTTYLQTSDKKKVSVGQSISFFI